jgi:hypothetical protein
MILSQGELIRQSAYTKSWKDIYYNNLMQIVYEHPKMKQLTDKAWFNEERGKDCQEIWMEILVWQVLIDHLINLRDYLFHVKCLTQEDIDQAKIDWDLACIRSTFLCACKDMALYDKLIQKINLSVDGLDNMVEELPDDADCDSPWIII